jgi:hypothetical protein
MIGPKNNYKFYGFSNFSSSAGLNSLKILNKGKRFFKFNDGQLITSTFCYVFLFLFFLYFFYILFYFHFIYFFKEYYNNSLIGTIRHESLGETIFIDQENNLKCIIKYGAVIGK